MGGCGSGIKNEGKQPGQIALCTWLVHPRAGQTKVQVGSKKGNRNAAELILKQWRIVTGGIDQAGASSIVTLHIFRVVPR